MTPGLRGKLAIAVVVVLAVLCYVIIATNAHRAVGGGIYEVAAADISYLDLTDAMPLATHTELSHLASQLLR
ncbi:MAG: hypothetical protein ABI343_19420 [Burkholderiaceae bacterium]